MDRCIDGEPRYLGKNRLNLDLSRCLAEIDNSWLGSKTREHDDYCIALNTNSLAHGIVAMQLHV